MTPSYVSLKAIQLLSETFFSKIKNKSYLEWDIKMGHPVHISGSNQLEESAYTYS